MKKLLEEAVDTMVLVLKDDDEVMAEARAGWQSGTNSGLRRSTLLEVEKTRAALEYELNNPFKGGIKLENGNTLYPPIT